MVNCGIIKHLSFFSWRHECELSSHAEIPNRDGCCAREHEPGGRSQKRPNVHHRGIHSASIGSRRRNVLARCTDVTSLAKEAIPSNPDMRQLQKAVVGAVVAHFRADVPHEDARQGRMCFHVSKLDHERMHASRFGVSVGGWQHELGVHNPMRSCSAEGTRPPLGCSQCGRVELELVRSRQVSGRGLNALNVATVPQFGLAVAANDLIILHQRLPVAELSCITLGLHGRHEGNVVQSRWKCLVRIHLQDVKLGWRQLVLLLELKKASKLRHHTVVVLGLREVAAIPLVEHAFAFQQRHHSLPHLRILLGAVQKVCHGVGTEGGCSPLAREIRTSSHA
eukprot:m.411807 g.411807  ORF g.411807 m.411807 type:complete len:337 (-) comp56558_c0_seq2:120-1130(-)